MPILVHNHDLRAVYPADEVDGLLAPLSARIAALEGASGGGGVASVLDFPGVDPTGAADSTDGFYAAVTSGKGPIFVPAGSYKLTNLVIDKSVTLIGAGRRPRSTGGPGETVIRAGDNVSPAITIKANSVSLRNMDFPGTAERRVAGGPAAIVVGESAPTSPLSGVILADLSIMSHGIGVHWLSASEWESSNVDARCFDAGMRVENVQHVDKGDSLIIGGLLASNSASGAGLEHRSGGGLKVVATKFLDNQDSIRIIWNSGLSGGIQVTSLNSENVSRDHIRVTGSSVMHGLTVTGGWFNGGQRIVNIDNSISLSRLNISGATLGGGGTTVLVNVGAKVNGFSIVGNYFDGNGIANSYGIVCASGCDNGYINANQFVNLTNKIANNSGGNVRVLGL